jgi:hypothetical protein
MSASAIYILDMKGKVSSIYFHYYLMIYSSIQVLISRNYRGDIEMNVIERFMQLLLEKEDESQLSPIFQHGDVAFVYIKYNNVYRKFLFLSISLVPYLFFKFSCMYNKNKFKYCNGFIVSL